MTDSKLFKLYLNKNPLIAKMFKLDQKLSEVREKIQAKLPSNTSFALSDGTKIDV